MSRKSAWAWRRAWSRRETVDGLFISPTGTASASEPNRTGSPAHPHAHTDPGRAWQAAGLRNVCCERSSPTTMAISPTKAQRRATILVSPWKATKVEASTTGLITRPGQHEGHGRGRGYALGQQTPDERHDAAFAAGHDHSHKGSGQHSGQRGTWASSVPGFPGARIPRRIRKPGSPKSRKGEASSRMATHSCAKRSMFSGIGTVRTSQGEPDTRGAVNGQRT